MLVNIVIALIGLSAGLLASAGVFALITSTGVITRMAGKTHTGRFTRTYETAVICGGIWWNIFWVFFITIPFESSFRNIFLGLTGICQGIFVGCLAVSLAEALNATAIFARRMKLKMGLSILVLVVAVSKIVSTVIQFYEGWVK